LAAGVEQQAYTPVWLEGLLPMLPSAIDCSRQGLYGRHSLQQLFAWDSLNPLRHWMALLETHPPLGDRLRLIMLYAKHWQLAPEVALPLPPRRQKALSQGDWQQLLFQGSPFFGLLFGLCLGLVLWGIGWIGVTFDVVSIDWMFRDLGLMQCSVCLGGVIGILLRMNRFFPDLDLAMAATQSMAEWIINPSLLPISSVPVKLSGTLIGRPGVANWLGQDLMIKTDVGLFTLHFFSVIGPLGNFLTLDETPVSHIGRSVQLLGWFRRGSQPWLDVDQIQVAKDKRLRAAHPMFSVLVAAGLLGFGLYVLFANDYQL
ncbi:MAG: hypothetical protein AAFU53_08610, partial [Cyanobacteria bacterium J06632_3]